VPEDHRSPFDPETTVMSDGIGSALDPVVSDPTIPDPRRLRLFAVEESISDAVRALHRAYRYETPHRDEIACLEDLARLLSTQILNEANGKK
jgi:hypothetical protein